MVSAVVTKRSMVNYLSYLKLTILKKRKNFNQVVKEFRKKKKNFDFQKKKFLY